MGRHTIVTLLRRTGRTVLRHSWRCAGAVVDNAQTTWKQTITGNGGLCGLWREGVAASHIHTRLAGPWSGRTLGDLLPRSHDRDYLPRSKWRLYSGIRRGSFCCIGWPPIRPSTVIGTVIHCANSAVSFSNATTENGGAAPW
jgi:hypothetical protein